MRLRFCCVCASLVMLVSGCASHRVMKTAQAPVVVNDTVREALPNDYLRVSFVPAGVKVTTLSRPGALRAFCDGDDAVFAVFETRRSPLLFGVGE